LEPRTSPICHSFWKHPQPLRLTALDCYVTFSTGSILLTRSHLLPDFRGRLSPIDVHGATLYAARHADDLYLRDFMTFFAFADRTTTGIIQKLCVVFV
jgi:hypothetical protein